MPAKAARARNLGGTSTDRRTGFLVPSCYLGRNFAGASESHVSSRRVRGKPMEPENIKPGANHPKAGDSESPKPRAGEPAAGNPESPAPQAADADLDSPVVHPKISRSTINE